MGILIETVTAAKVFLNLSPNTLLFFSPLLPPELTSPGGKKLLLKNRKGVLKN